MGRSAFADALRRWGRSIGPTTVWPRGASAARAVPFDDESPLRAELFSTDQMEQHGARLASAHSVTPGRVPDQLLARLSDLRTQFALGNERAQTRIAVIQRLALQAGELAHKEYGFLYDKDSHPLSIGYNVDERRRGLLRSACLGGPLERFRCYLPRTTAQTPAAQDQKGGVMIVTVDDVAPDGRAIPLVDDRQEHAVAVRVNATADVRDGPAAGPQLA